MTYLEYDWTYDVYRFRFGDRFTSFQGWQSFHTKADAEYVLRQAGCKLGKKTDTRTWQVLPSNTAGE